MNNLSQICCYQKARQVVRVDGMWSKMCWLLLATRGPKNDLLCREITDSDDAYLANLNGDCV